MYPSIRNRITEPGTDRESAIRGAVDAVMARGWLPCFNRPAHTVLREEDRGAICSCMQEYDDATLASITAGTTMFGTHVPDIKYRACSVVIMNPAPALEQHQPRLTATDASPEARKEGAARLREVIE